MERTFDQAVADLAVAVEVKDLDKVHQSMQEVISLQPSEIVGRDRGLFTVEPYRAAFWLVPNLAGLTTDQTKAVHDAIAAMRKSEEGKTVPWKEVLKGFALPEGLTLKEPITVEHLVRREMAISRGWAAANKRIASEKAVLEAQATLAEIQAKTAFVQSVGKTSWFRIAGTRLVQWGTKLQIEDTRKKIAAVEDLARRQGELEEMRAGLIQK